MQATQPKQFGKLRNFLWPIHGYEHKKLLPMFAIFFLIAFIYNLLRCMKVTLVVTPEGSGAEVIPFLKVWAVLPGAVLVTYLYTKLSSKLNREQVFYTMIGIFLGFFTLFLLVLYPNREALELTKVAAFLQDKLPEGLKGLISVIRYWPLSFFYVLSDLWSAVVLSMLFWGFANEVTSVNEAKRFYAIFALGANFSGIFSGQSAQFLTLQDWESTLKLQLGAVLVLGLGIILIFRWVNRSIITRSTVVHPTPSELEIEAAEAAKKLSLKECFSYLIRSRYMLYIVILVVAYNIVYNFTDVLWTDQVKQRYPSAADFNAYINNVSSVTGIFATLFGLILSGNIIRRYGWTATALITPLIWLVTSVGFFGCMLFDDNHNLSDFMYALFSIPASTMVLFFGSAQICLGRAAKYTVFDETKEIAFIPLPKENQRKGKAVVDGIASRFGKSGGSFAIQIMLVLCGELIFTIPYIAAIFLIVITLWLFAVVNLGKLVKTSIDEHDKTDTVPIVPDRTVDKVAVSKHATVSAITEVSSV